MIRLNNTPNEGSTVKVNIGFRDSAGIYYIPSQISYSLLALNNDMESWSICDDLYKVPVTPASNVTLTVPDIKTFEGTTLNRKIMVYWDAFVDGEYNSFVDEITFDINPKPYVPDEPVNPPAPLPVYVEINDVNLQVGTLSAAPVNPVFILKTNLPVKIDTAVAMIDTKPCKILKDSTGGILTVYPETVLDYVKSYTLTISGLVSTINGYVMKEDFNCSFVTQSEDTPHEPIIEDKTVVEITENGVHNILPTEGYDATKEVELTVDVHPALQEKTVTANGTVEPDSDFYGLSKVDVQLPLETTHYEAIRSSGESIIEPSAEAIAMQTVRVNVIPDQDKEITIITNGDSVVKADTGRLLNEVIIHTNVPLHNIQNSKSVNIMNNTTNPIVVNPDSGYDCLKKVEITVNVPAASISLYAYRGTNTNAIFYSTKLINNTGDYNILVKKDDGTLVDFATYAVTVGDPYTSLEFEGNQETITYESGSNITR